MPPFPRLPLPRIFVAFAIFLCATNPSHAVPNIILDTDFRSDIDDVGALGMIHALQDQGKVVLLGVIGTTATPNIVGAIDAVNTYYGRKDLPIGLYNGTALNADQYTPTLANPRNFVSNQHNSTAPVALSLYRSLLNNAPNASVKIVVVGGESAIAQLLQSPANANGDGINLTGLQLIQNKVTELDIMGGDFSGSTTTEWNIGLDIPAAQQIAGSWPTKVVYSGFEVGDGILTGSALTNPQVNPVAMAWFVSNYDTGGSNGIGNRSSWDESAALYGIVGTSYNGTNLWSVSGPQTIGFTNSGATTKTPNSSGNRYYLTLNSTQESNATTVISNLMTALPATVGPRPAPLVTLAQYEFAGGSGDTLTDGSPNAATGTLRNFANTAAGAGNSLGSSGWTSSQQLRFDGVDDYVQSGVTLANIAGGSFTVEARFQFEGPATRTWTPVFGSSFSPFDANEVFFVGKTTGTNALTVHTGALANFNVTNPGIFDGAPHHLAVVFDAPAATMRVYRDGVLISTQTGLTASFTGGSDLLIGATGHASGERWLGWINYARCTGTALTVSQLDQHIRKLESESLTVPNYLSAAGGTARIFADAFLSGGNGSILDSNNIGDYVTYLVPGVLAGSYNIKAGVKKYSSRGIFQLAIGRSDDFTGTASDVGPAEDEYSASSVYTALDLGTWAPGTTGDKWFRFRVVGKNAASAGTLYNDAICIDYITLTPQ